MVKNLHGIESDGCLNAVYTNIPANGIIYNEIDRKVVSLENDELEKEFNDKIVGDYSCRWFDLDNKVSGYTLEIRNRTPAILNVYTFNWRTQGGNIKFEGIGYKMNDRQIAVSYWPTS